jgi:hypothetical protein
LTTLRSDWDIDTINSNNSKGSVREGASIRVSTTLIHRRHEPTHTDKKQTLSSPSFKGETTAYFFFLFLFLKTTTDEPPPHNKPHPGHLLPPKANTDHRMSRSVSRDAAPKEDATAMAPLTLIHM